MSTNIATQTNSTIKAGEKTPEILFPTGVAFTREYQKDPEIIARTERFKQEYIRELKVHRMLHIKIVR